MVGTAEPPKSFGKMLRSAASFAIALACTLSANAAKAQDPGDLVTRLDRLEQTIRDLTGQVEQLQYRNQQLEQQVQRLQGQAPGGAAPSASTAPQNSPTSSQYTVVPQYSPPPPQAQYSPPPQPQYSPPPAPVIASAPAAAPIASDGTPGRDAFNPALHPNAPGVPHPLGSSTDATELPPPAPPALDASAPPQPGAPLNLSDMSAPAGGPPDNATPGGALPPPPAANPSSTGITQQAALPATGTPKDEYDLGYGYVLQKNYGLAEDTFHDFLRKYPSDRLTPEAQYWLGEALFQDQKYRDAAESFLAVSTKYESTARAPDALLRLGESLAALGEKEAACASLGEVLRKYPHASANVKQSVDREQKRAHC